MSQRLYEVPLQTWHRQPGRDRLETGRSELGLLFSAILDPIRLEAPALTVDTSNGYHPGLGVTAHFLTKARFPYLGEGMPASAARSDRTSSRALS